MNDKEFVLDTMSRAGLSAAEDLQAKSPDMTGTELYAAEDYIPDFQAAKAAKNMLERKAGQADGFVCRSTAGRVVRLIQPYDSETYPQEPEDLPAQWRFVWSTDPKKALPFVKISTSPYATGDCATENGHVWQSTIDNNVFAPSEYPRGWKDLGTIEEVMAGTQPEPEPDEPETGGETGGTEGSGETTDPEEPTEPTDPEPEPEPSEPEIPEGTPVWEEVETGYTFKAGTQFVYGGKLYDVIRALTKTPGWEPPALLGDFYKEAEA